MTVRASTKLPTLLAILLVAEGAATVEVAMVVEVATAATSHGKCDHASCRPFFVCVASLSGVDFDLFFFSPKLILVSSLGRVFWGIYNESQILRSAKTEM